MVTTYTEDFTGVAAALSGSWTQQRTSGTINRNGFGLGIGSVNAKDLFAYWSANTFGNDQYSQARIAGGLSSGSQFVQIIVRANGKGDGSYNNYLFYTDGVAGAGHTEVAKNINGTQITFRSFATTFAAGDVIKIGVVGTTITCYKNGVALGTVTDASLTSGAPGVGVHGSTVTVDDWEGGSTVTTTTQAPVATVTVSPASASVVVSNIRMNLAAAVPRGDLASSGYCLAVVGSEYLVLLPSGGSVRVNLAGVSGSRTVEWFNPANGQTTTRSPVTGGTTVTLTAPFSGTAVVYIHP